MAGGRQNHDWTVAAHQMALLANCHRDSKQRQQPYLPRDFNPLAPPPPKPKKYSVDILKTVFIDRKLPKE